MKELTPPTIQGKRNDEKQAWSPPLIKKIPSPDTYYGGGMGNDGLDETSQIPDVTG
jgi:hypothetical protein